MTKSVRWQDTSKLMDSLYEININRLDDKYDNYGRNISAQKRRQEREPWITVSYKRRSYVK